ncbi:MAG: ABC transporter substrate-binding protein [Alkalispirochaeta sp.]|jgi:iron complex transport system substrate-binding protein
MTRIRIPFVVLMIGITSALFATGVAEPGATAADPAPAATRTVIDGLGREVVIPADFTRVVTIPIPFASVFTAIDGTGERIIGMHPASLQAVEESILGTMAPELLDAETDFISEGFQVNLESLLALRPDIVFQWWNQPAEIEKIEAAGIPVIAVGGGGQDFRSVRDWLILAGNVTGKTERLDSLLTQLAETEAEIARRTAAIPEDQRVRVLCLHTPPLQARAYDWIETVGAVNVAVGMPNWISEIDIEQLYAWNPQVIVLSNFVDTQPDDLYHNRVANHDFSPIEAVQAGHVYKIPMGAYRWDPPSQESGLMLWWLAKTFYPDLFADIDLHEKIRDFYNEFYGYAVSESEIELILSSPGTAYWRGFR